MTLKEFKALVADVRKKRTKRQRIEKTACSARESEGRAYDSVMKEFRRIIREDVLPDGVWSPIHEDKDRHQSLYVVRTTTKLPPLFKEYFKVAASRSYHTTLYVPAKKKTRGGESIIDFSAKLDPKLKTWRYSLQVRYRRDPLSYVVKQLKIKIDPKTTVVATLEKKLEPAKRDAFRLQDDMKKLTSAIKEARDLRGETKPKKRAGKK